MGSNEQTEPTGKIDTDSQIQNRMTANGVVKGGGIEQNGKRTHGLGQQCGDCLGDGGIRGPNGNGKNIIKIKF